MTQETFFEPRGTRYERIVRVEQTSGDGEPLAYGVVVSCSIPSIERCAAYSEFTLQADGSWQGRNSSGNDFTFWSTSADDIQHDLRTWGRIVKTFHRNAGIPKHLRFIWELAEEEACKRDAIALTVALFGAGK